MTGMEVWSIMAPLIVSCLDMKQEVSHDVYLTVFQALKAFDEKEKEIKGK